MAELKGVAYKIAKRHVIDPVENTRITLTPEQVIDIHLEHAQKNDGKVLFTTQNKFPSVKNRELISKLMLIYVVRGKTKAQNTGYAVLADLDDLGKYTKGDKPTPDYTVPTYWENESLENRKWFALSNVKRIEINIGDYTTQKKKDFFTVISGRPSMVYFCS